MLRLSPPRAGSAAGIAGGRASTEASVSVVARGRFSVPVDTETLPSVSTRTASSAPTRLSRSARGLPLNRLALENPTSALGALAISVPSRSRTLMSRMRMAARPCSSRSSTVPPTSMRNWLPTFSAIAAVSHGVMISREIGPARQAPPQRSPDQQKQDETARHGETDAAHPAQPHGTGDPGGATPGKLPPPRRRTLLIAAGNVGRTTQMAAEGIEVPLACDSRALGLRTLMHVQARLHAVQGSELRSFRLSRHALLDAP